MKTIELIFGIYFPGAGKFGNKNIVVSQQFREFRDRCEKKNLHLEGECGLFVCMERDATGRLIMRGLFQRVLEDSQWRVGTILVDPDLENDRSGLCVRVLNGLLAEIIQKAKKGPIGMQNLDTLIRERQAQERVENWISKLAGASLVGSHGEGYLLYQPPATKSPVFILSDRFKQSDKSGWLSDRLGWNDDGVGLAGAN